MHIFKVQESPLNGMLQLRLQKFNTACVGAVETQKLMSRMPPRRSENDDFSVRIHRNSEIVWKHDAAEPREVTETG
jgi:hypothetical protein